MFTFSVHKKTYEVASGKCWIFDLILDDEEVCAGFVKLGALRTNADNRDDKFLKNFIVYVTSVFISNTVRMLNQCL